MKKGLVIGKFMPVHKGHLALIDFALAYCDELIVLLCYHPGEPIPISFREMWMQKLLAGKHTVTLTTLEYNPDELTSSSEPIPEYAKAWAQEIKKHLPRIDVLFSSEAYGDNLAFYLTATHIPFDYKRSYQAISASSIRSKPFTYWQFLPPIVQSYFIKKIMVLGSESTGKSVLTEKLATHYNTSFVSEMAREVIELTNECTYQDLLKIADVHAKAIISKTKEANKILLCDTDATITKSYSLFLFKKTLELPNWIEEANKGDLYIFLDMDCPYIQDGTRVSKAHRELLSIGHKKQLHDAGIIYKTISGNWDERFITARKLIDDFISKY